MAFTARNVLPQRLVDQLRKIAPSRDRNGRIYPCKLVLLDTSVVERALLIEEPHGLPGKGVALEEIAFIEKTPWRLPPHLALKLYDAGESGMGYSIFKMRLRDGRVIASHNGGSLMDFPGLPSGVVGTDVAEVYPHEGREMYGTNECFDPPGVAIVYFVFPESR